MAFIQTSKETQEPGFIPEGSKAIIKSELDNLSFAETIKDSGKGMAAVRFEFSADSNISMNCTYFAIELPNNEYSDVHFSFINKEKIPADTSSKTGHRSYREMFRPVPHKNKEIIMKTKRRDFENSRC